MSMKRRSIHRARNSVIGLRPAQLPASSHGLMQTTTTNTGSVRMRHVKRRSFDSNNHPSLTRAGMMSNSGDPLEHADDDVQHTREVRFPRLEDLDHLHYDHVQLGPLRVSLCEDGAELTKITYMNSAVEDVEEESCIHVQHWFHICVQSRSRSWTIRRSYQDFCLLVKQLHECVYDLDEYSPLLDRLPASLELDEESIRCLLANYLDWFSRLAGDFIHCAPVLNWLQLDNRGNRLIVTTQESAINTPAVAGAMVVKRYPAQAADELSLEVGDMISVIEMPPREDSFWWRGKRAFEVGFFPSDCVEVIGEQLSSTSCTAARFIRRNLNGLSLYSEPGPGPNPLLDTPVKGKPGRIVTFLRDHLLHGRAFRGGGGGRGYPGEPGNCRVFGADLSDHLAISGTELPLVLTTCSQYIEKLGIVDGIYRLSGVSSNIQRLRNTFNDDRVPNFDQDQAIVQDIHCVSSLLKMYFRELPDPLLTYDLYDRFVCAVQPICGVDPSSPDYVPESTKLENLRELIRHLPPPNYRSLEYLTRHLARMASHYALTGMTAKNLAIVWAPNLLRCQDIEQHPGLAALHVIGVQAVLTEYLIRFVEQLFDDRRLAKGCCFRPKSKLGSAAAGQGRLLTLEEARSRRGLGLVSNSGHRP